MLTLLKASDILNVGLTVTQVFYLVGRQATKGLCRFVKTESIKTAISTLLSIKGTRRQVEDIRLTDFGGLKVWTDQGIETIPSAEATAFLTCYNELATSGCNSECRCADDPENIWKSFCVHKIAEHLTGVKEKVDAICATKFSASQENLLAELRVKLNQRSLSWEEFQEDGDTFFKVGDIGHIIVTDVAEILILSAVAGSKEIAAKNPLEAVLKLQAASLPPIEPGTRSGLSWSKSEEYRRVREYCNKTYKLKNGKTN